MTYKRKSWASLRGLNMPGESRAISSVKRLGTQEGDGYRTPLFQDVDVAQVLDSWEEQVKDTSWMPLEQRERSKVGPFYRRPFAEWKDKLEAYFVHDARPFSLDPFEDAALESAYIRVRDRLTDFIKVKLVPLDIREAVERAKRGTNLGMPLMTSDWSDTALKGYVQRAERLVQGKASKLFPFILFYRSQPGGFKTVNDEWPNKNRPVWGADHAETFSGLCFQIPLVERLRTHPSFADLDGIDAVEALVRGFSGLVNPYWKFSLDLSSADANFSPLLQLIGLRMLNDLMVCPIGYLEQVYQYYTTGEIITPDGVWEGWHGMPSGVLWTNFFERFAFLVLYELAVTEQGFEPSDSIVVCQCGDDGLYITNKQIDTEVFTSSWARFGCVVNDTKSTNSQTDASYLQRHFMWTGNPMEDGVAVMSTMRMLGRILFAERGVDPAKTGMSVADYWTLNTISKLENCKRHPKFIEFVEFVKGGDKFGLDVSSFLDSSGQHGKGILTIGTGVDGQPLEVSGLANFESIKVLTSGTLQGEGD